LKPPTVIFCDTSTLAKYYVPELETRAVQTRFDAADAVWASELARTELMAVFHRRFREKKWSESIFRTVVRQFQLDDTSGLWRWTPLSAEITREAAQVFTALPRTVFLRASDCIHLVSARQSGFEEIHTHDRHQIAAAKWMELKAMAIKD
jgi:predicted nucleic acid-binding protein